MKLTNSEKRTIEEVMKEVIKRNPKGIDTRTLITDVHSVIRTSIPNANRYHISGMIAWIVASTDSKLIVRTPGYSVIA
ncbi:MAG: hypothetical protein GX947_05270 [Tissierellia bacterium]|nr:hypothetical protein [Tissierellia bacterium]